MRAVVPSPALQWAKRVGAGSFVFFFAKGCMWIALSTLAWALR